MPYMNDLLFTAAWIALTFLIWKNWRGIRKKAGVEWDFFTSLAAAVAAAVAAFLAMGVVYGIFFMVGRDQIEQGEKAGRVVYEVFFMAGKN